jgi:hypothetical protein
VLNARHGATAGISRAAAALRAVAFPSTGVDPAITGEPPEERGVQRPQ